MDFESAWCPACDRQIQPKRYTVNVPVLTNQPPPPPPPSLKARNALKHKQGLVNGTGRVRHNGTIRAPTPPQQPQVTLRPRLVIDQGPIPLYCSDQCQMADRANRRQSPASLSTTSDETESDESSVSTPPKPLTTVQKFAKLYNLPPLPPPLPIFDEPEPVRRPVEYNSGVMMAGRLISSLCPKPAKPRTGRYDPAPEPPKQIPGWNDGSNAWRSTVYNFSPPNSIQDPFSKDDSLPSSQVASSHRPSRSLYSLPALPALSTPSATSHSQSDEMIAKFSQCFTRRAESRASLYSNSGACTATPSSPASTHSLPPPRRERSLVAPEAQGKLLVPDVKLKVRNGSSGSLSSAWSGPTSASSRRSVRSPLSVTSDTSEDAEDLNKPSKRPTVETRSWSYDNVQTYPIMQLPPKKVKQMEKQIVDGEEVEVEVEVEVYEERKRLFLFAPSRVSR